MILTQKGILSAICIFPNNVFLHLLKYLPFPELINICVTHPAFRHHIILETRSQIFSMLCHFLDPLLLMQALKQNHAIIASNVPLLLLTSLHSKPHKLNIYVPNSHVAPMIQFLNDAGYIEVASYDVDPAHIHWREHFLDHIYILQPSKLVGTRRNTDDSSDKMQPFEISVKSTLSHSQ
ncbi:hypothetical protein NP233_g10224 [Leucocoprinus birnbaumii]|uniref:F-box domain-containing protein n=1 Tax=Leucocoprinus birnbaumii TaxID=56174 RepID=A0AAD5YQ27_9AGAR|nr:hypothetical protein NP233_g10224 [Leucocoprinus birnbaumii]